MAALWARLASALGLFTSRLICSDSLAGANLARASVASASSARPRSLIQVWRRGLPVTSEGISGVCLFPASYSCRCLRRSRSLGRLW